MSAQPSPQETLRWERERRTWAGGAAIAAAALTFSGNLLISLALRDLPKAEDRAVTVVDALRDAVANRPIPRGRLSIQAQYLGEHVTGPIAGAILVALGTLLLFLPLAYLFRATRARHPSLGQWVLVLVAVGAVFSGIGNLAVNLARDLGAHDFVAGADKSNSAAGDALTQSPYMAGQILAQVGSLAMGFGLVLTALNAMRVGLLTRFMGVLGMIVGVTFVLPLDQLGIIRSFWLLALGAVLLGRWPSGIPKAWQTGEAAPWPSRQQAREAAERARREKSAGATTEPAAPRRRAPAPETPAPPRPEPRAGVAHSSSKKKRRKRRS